MSVVLVPYLVEGRGGGGRKGLQRISRLQTPRLPLPPPPLAPTQPEGAASRPEEAEQVRSSPQACGEQELDLPVLHPSTPYSAYLYPKAKLHVTCSRMLQREQVDCSSSP